MEWILPFALSLGMIASTVSGLVIGIRIGWTARDDRAKREAAMVETFE